MRDVDVLLTDEDELKGIKNFESPFDDEESRKEMRFMLDEYQHERQLIREAKVDLLMAICGMPVEPKG